MHLVSLYCATSPGSSLLGDRATEEEDVRLWVVQHVVDPAQALLHTQVPPLVFGHEPLGHGQQLGNILANHA